MTLLLNNIKPAEGARKTKMRLGRGIGSGKGKTCGRGHKGFLARAGSGRKLGFEGGQMPLQRRLPKSGFVSRDLKFFGEIQLSVIAKLAEKEITLSLLKDKKLVKNYIREIKVIGKTDLSTPLVLRDMRVSASVRAQIEAAGGQILEAQKPEVEK